MRQHISCAGLCAMGIGGLFSGAAHAQALEVVGAPTQGGMGFQPAATTVASGLQNLDYMILVIIGVITVFVTVMLGVVALRFNRRANPAPAKFTHNSPLEIAWTLGPVLVLVFIGSFSLPELFKQQDFAAVKPDLTIKVTGNQWFWSYEYPEIVKDDGETLIFDGFLLAKEDLAANGYDDSLYLLATDTAVVVPVGKTVLVQVTGSDVIHSWKVPAFGVMQDAVPGRLAQTWFKADKEGIYFGQCSEICGKDHAYMPITVKVVSQAAYDQWVAKAKSTGDVQLAAN